MAVIANSTSTTIRDRRRDRAAIRGWLYIVALLIVAMIVVGGATRLTDSGLSITEWQPIHGVVPPLNADAWQEEFAKYREIPEYQLINKGMTLGEFKAIYWWEWAHRFLGRLIGVVVLVPLVVFWLMGWVERAVLPRLIAMFVLGGLQGGVGWWMVASGLSQRTDVSQYRLAIHLTLACVILAYVLWVARGLAADASGPASGGLRRMAMLILGLVFLQIFLGGLVAGLDAGLTFNTWPLMDGRVVPAGLLIQSPFWRNFFESVATVQFDHRLGAYLLFAAAIFHAFWSRGTAHVSQAWILAALVAAQAALGIAALVSVVPLSLALLQQLGAVVVLSVAVIHLRAMSPPQPIEPIAAAMR
jgi:cytochrome c oxidase assembly protein subunit 15